MPPAPRVFTIPPGAPFLATFAQALKSGAVLPGMDDPLTLSRTVIYVPTRRAARALAHEIARAFDKPALLLPRIRPLGGLEETQTALLFGESGADGTPALETPLAIGDIARKMLANIEKQLARTDLLLFSDFNYG